MAAAPEKGSQMKVYYCIEQIDAKSVGIVPTV